MKDNTVEILKVKEHHLSLEADPFRMKIIAEGTSKYMDEHGLDDTTLRDFCYNMEVYYQRYFDLHEDDWGFTEDHDKAVHGAF